MKTLIAFNGDAQLKKDLLAEVIKHRKADAIVKGPYGKTENGQFKGCAVGCSLKSYSNIKGVFIDTSNHVEYEKFGIPRLLARLEDSIFEGLPSTHNKKWPEQFLSAINVGADLSSVWPKFAQYLLTDKKHGVIQYAKTDAQRAAIQKVSDLYRYGGSINDFKLARAAASYAASYAAYAVSYAASYAAYAAADDDAADSSSYAAYAVFYAASYAAYAAYAAAADDDAADSSSYAAYAVADDDDAADSSSYAAYAVADDDDADSSSYAAKYKNRIAQSKELIRLMKECK